MVDDKEDSRVQSISKQAQAHVSIIQYRWAVTIISLHKTVNVAGYGLVCFLMWFIWNGSYESMKRLISRPLKYRDLRLPRWSRRFHTEDHFCLNRMVAEFGKRKPSLLFRWPMFVKKWKMICSQKRLQHFGYHFCINIWNESKDNVHSFQSFSIWNVFSRWRD